MNLLTQLSARKQVCESVQRFPRHLFCVIAVRSLAQKVTKEQMFGLIDFILMQHKQTFSQRL